MALTAIVQRPEVVANINTYKSVPGAAGRHVLHYAVEHDAEAPVLAALVTAGADINKKSHNGHTPLVFAISTENKPAIEQLIALGANVDSPGGSGLPPLAYAAMANNTEVMGLLLAAGAHVDQANSHGATALEMAARHGHIEAAKLLLAAGASITGGVAGAKEDMPADMRAFLDAQIRGRAANAKMAAIGRTHVSLPEEIMAMVSQQVSGVKKRPSSNTYRKVGGKRRGRKTHKAGRR